MSKETLSSNEVAGPRTVGWFSCGDASAVACALALKEYVRVEIVRIIVTGEHPDNERFAADCERWYGRKIVVLQDPEKRSAYDVWVERRYISGIAGAPCTGELKKAVRFRYQRPDDIHVWGFTWDERKRAETFEKNNPEIYCAFPLIRYRLRKEDCHAIVRDRGIELPAMYRLGFNNNNCIGCCKGGAGYWNKTREIFPEVFERTAKLSRELGARMVQHRRERVFLDQLPTDAGRLNDPVIECSPFCEPAKQRLADETEVKHE